MRKDVECTFGILKGRWQTLKTGVRLHGVDKVDQVWFTCCALHNWLLEIDGLSNEWSDGVPVSEWEGPLGDNDFEGVRVEVPNAIARLSMNLDPRNFDCSGIGPGKDVREEMMSLMNEHPDVGDDPDDRCVGDRTQSVRYISLSYFRRQLVVHFKIMFEGNKLVCPRSRSSS